MSAVKHTAGPCTIREFNPVDGYFVLISDANGGLFAKAYDPRKAKLIAAAPAMLEALETIASIAPGEGDVCELIARRARAAIAKATGA
jgi:hypothetical protein